MSKILLISKDDDPDCKLIQGVFRRLGHETICLNDVRDAGKHLAAGDIYAVFVDFDTITENTALEELFNAAKPYTIVVLIGTDDKFHQISSALDKGADDYLRKPFNSEIFEAKTRGVFARYDDIRNINVNNINTLLDTMPSMVSITDGNGKIIYANTTIRNKFGLKPEDVEGRLMCDVFSCGNFQKGDESFRRNCESCKFYESEREVFKTGRKIIRKSHTFPQMRDGIPHTKALRFSIAPIDYGNRKAVFNSLEDITFERNAINELTATICALRESRDNSEEEVKVNRDLANYLQSINESLQTEKRKLQLLFDNMDSGFLLAEYKDGNLFFREGNAKLSEITQTDLTQRYGRKLTAGSDLYLEDFCTALLDVAKTGQPIGFNTTSPDKSIDYRVNVYVPEPGYVAAIINDITEVTKTHRENRERARQLQRLNIMLDDRNSELQKAIETKNKFISLIAHDLRNPLNAINGLSDLLSRRLGPSGDQRALDMAKVLHQSAKGAYELLDNLLIWARTQQNTIQFNPETLNLHSVAAETINEIKVQAERKHIMLINSTETNDTIWADKLMLQTIIRNIVSNAIKFTNEGGLIVIASSQTADNTTITIEDNGVGMTQETIDKIIGATELNSTKGTSGETGTGMGLIISKEFIQRHQGTLDIESTIGKGSTFIIKLPGDKKLNEK